MATAITIISGILIGLIKTLHGTLNSSVKSLKEGLEDVNKNVNSKFSDLDKKMAVSMRSMYYMDKELVEVKEDVKNLKN
jgi:hypothetical protein